MEEETNPETEVEESVEAEEIEAEQSVYESDDSEEEIEYVQLERNGRMYEVPKELESELMMQSDYTKKTQELSEQRKSLDSLKEEINKTREAQQADFEEYATIHALNNYLKTYENVDWNQMSDEDPIGAQQKFMEYQSLKDKLTATKGNLEKKQSERALQMQRDTAKREEEGRAVLQREIKGWSPETESSLREYAKSLGVPNVDKTNFALYPAETIILNKARLFDQLSRKQAQKPQEPVKPASKIKSGKAAANKDPSKMSQDEYSQWRRKRIANRNR